MARRSSRRRLGPTSDEQDRLSSLPDTLLVDILNLLPIETAVTTSVLSRRWRHLWTQLTDIVFDGRHFPPGDGGCYRPKPFYDAIDCILKQLTSPKIRRFFLHFPYFWTPVRLESWSSSVHFYVRQICARKPEEFEVRTHTYIHRIDPLFSVSTCILQCESLINLVLVGHLCVKLPDNRIVSLPNLNKLHLKTSILDPDLLAALFKSCPLLENVHLCGQFSDSELRLDLSAQKLRSFHIDMLGIPPRVEFVINASTLEDLAIYSPGLAYYRFVENQTTSNLIAADICLRPEYLNGLDYLSHTEELGRMICSVMSLSLNATTLEAFNGLSCCQMFNNLTQLRIKLDCSNGCWNDVLRFLCGCPNLEVLVVSLPEHNETAQVIKWSKPTDRPPCLDGQLKTFRLENLRCNPAEVKMTKFIIDNSSALELLFVHVSTFVKKQGTQLSKEHKFCVALFRLPVLRKDPPCEIKFFGNYLRASSKDYKMGTLDCKINSFGYW